MKTPSSHTLEIDGVTRFFLFMLAMGVILWLGGTVFRAVIANEFFLPGTLDFAPAINMSQERLLFQLVSAASTVVVSAYGVVLVCAIIVLKRIPHKVKDHGWLLMASILFFMFVPVEIFTAWLDIHLIFDWLEAKAAYVAGGPAAYDGYRTDLQATLSHRIGALHGLPVMAILSYFTAVAVLILQPIRHAGSSTQEQE